LSAYGRKQEDNTFKKSETTDKMELLQNGTTSLKNTITVLENGTTETNGTTDANGSTGKCKH
jgi:hypothetical protein